MKSSRSFESYRRNFSELMDALRLSSEAYDKGYNGEAKRLAVCARVMVHDTERSVSLFEQVGLKRKLLFFGSPNPYSKNNLATECHLVMMHVGPQPNFLPLLDSDPMGKGWQRLPFDTWWNESVIRDKHRERFSRKDLILWYANKEGGAHIDPLLDERYRRLSEDNSFDWTFKTGNTEVLPASGVEFACMRQIAHELQQTILKNPKTIKRHLGWTASGGR